MAKSRDAFRTISEVAEWLDVPTHVLRFWESRFTQVKPVKRAGGRRYYRPSDMELLGGIKSLLHDQGLTIRGVQKLLRDEGVKHVAALAPPVDVDETGDGGDGKIVHLQPKSVDQAPNRWPFDEDETAGKPVVIDVTPVDVTPKALPDASPDVAEPPTKTTPTQTTPPQEDADQEAPPVVAASAQPEVEAAPDAPEDEDAALDANADAQAETDDQPTPDPLDTEVEETERPTDDAAQAEDPDADAPPAAEEVEDAAARDMLDAPLEEAVLPAPSIVAPLLRVPHARLRPDADTLGTVLDRARHLARVMDPDRA